MDFHNMKRKDLQVLCKKHNIRANMPNQELINNLNSILKVEEEKPRAERVSCMKDSGEIARANDSRALERRSRKVRFSVDVENIEMEKTLDGKGSLEVKKGFRRRSMIKPDSNKLEVVTEKVVVTESLEQRSEISVRTTRSRAGKSMEEGGVTLVQSPLVERKRSKRRMDSESIEVKNEKPPLGANDSKAVSQVDDIETRDLKNSSDRKSPPEMKKGSTRRSMIKPELKKKLDQIDEKVDIIEPHEEISVRTTRSRAGKSMEGHDELSEVSVRTTRSRAGKSIGGHEELSVVSVRTTRSHAGKSMEGHEELSEVSVRTTRSHAGKSMEGGVTLVQSPLFEGKRAKIRVDSEWIEVKDDEPLFGANDSKAVRRQPKRVRFHAQVDNVETTTDLEKSPDRETPPEMKKGSRRRSMINPDLKKLDQIAENVDITEPREEISEVPVRTTRSRAGKSMEGGVTLVQLPPPERKKVKTRMNSESNEVKSDNPPTVMNSPAATEAIRGPVRRSSRRKVLQHGVEGNVDKVDMNLERTRGANKKGIEKDAERILEVSKISIANESEQLFKPETVLKRSKRNVLKAEALPVSGVLDTNEMYRRNTRSRIQMVGEGSAAQIETGIGIGVQRDSELVLQLEEPMRCSSRNTSKHVSCAPPGVTTENVEVNHEEEDGIQNIEEECPRSSKRHASKRKSLAPSSGKGSDEALGKNQTGKQSKQLIFEVEASQDDEGSGFQERGKWIPEERPLRRSKRNISELESTSPIHEKITKDETAGRDEPLKQLKSLEKEAAAIEKRMLEGPPTRSKRNASEPESASLTHEKITKDATGRDEPLKQLKRLEEEEEEPIEKRILEGPLRRSKRNASEHESISPTHEKITEDETSGRNELWKRKRDSIPVQESPLPEGLSPTTGTPTKNVSLHEESAIVDAGLPILKAAGGSDIPASSCIQEVPEEMSKKMRRSGRRSSTEKLNRSMKACFTTDLKEVEKLAEVNLLETGVSNFAKLQRRSKRNASEPEFTSPTHENITKDETAGRVESLKQLKSLEEGETIEKRILEGPRRRSKRNASEPESISPTHEKSTKDETAGRYEPLKQWKSLEEEEEEQQQQQRQEEASVSERVCQLRNHEMHDSLSDCLVVMDKEGLQTGDDKAGSLEVEQSDKNDLAFVSQNSQRGFDHTEVDEPVEFVEEAREHIPSGNSSVADGLSPTHQPDSALNFSAAEEMETAKELFSVHQTQIRDDDLLEHEAEKAPKVLQSSEALQISVENVTENATEVQSSAQASVEASTAPEYQDLQHTPPVYKDEGKQEGNSSAVQFTVRTSQFKSGDATDSETEIVSGTMLKGDALVNNLGSEIVSQVKAQEVVKAETGHEEASCGVGSGEVDDKVAPGEFGDHSGHKEVIDEHGNSICGVSDFGEKKASVMASMEQYSGCEDRNDAYREGENIENFSPLAPRELVSYKNEVADVNPSSKVAETNCSAKSAIDALPTVYNIREEDKVDEETMERDVYLQDFKNLVNDANVQSLINAESPNLKNRVNDEEIVQSSINAESPDLKNLVNDEENVQSSIHAESPNLDDDHVGYEKEDLTQNNGSIDTVSDEATGESEFPGLKPIAGPVERNQYYKDCLDATKGESSGNFLQVTCDGLNVSVPDHEKESAELDGSAPELLDWSVCNASEERSGVNADEKVDQTEEASNFYCKDSMDALLEGEKTLFFPQMDVSELGDCEVPKDNAASNLNQNAQIDLGEHICKEDVGTSAQSSAQFDCLTDDMSPNGDGSVVVESDEVSSENFKVAEVEKKVGAAEENCPEELVDYDNYVEEVDEVNGSDETVSGEHFNGEGYRAFNKPTAKKVIEPSIQVDPEELVDYENHVEEVDKVNGSDETVSGEHFNENHKIEDRAVVTTMEINTGFEDGKDGVIGLEILGSIKCDELKLCQFDSRNSAETSELLDAGKNEEASELLQIIPEADRLCIENVTEKVTEILNSEVNHSSIGVASFAVSPLECEVSGLNIEETYLKHTQSTYKDGERQEENLTAVQFYGPINQSKSGEAIDYETDIFGIEMLTGEILDDILGCEVFSHLKAQEIGKVKKTQHEEASYGVGSSKGENNVEPESTEQNADCGDRHDVHKEGENTRYSSLLAPKVPVEYKEEGVVDIGRSTDAFDPLRCNDSGYTGAEKLSFRSPKIPFEKLERIDVRFLVDDEENAPSSIKDASSLVDDHDNYGKEVLPHENDNADFILDELVSVSEFTTTKANVETLESNHHFKDNVNFDKGEFAEILLRVTPDGPSESVMDHKRDSAEVNGRSEKGEASVKADVDADEKAVCTNEESNVNCENTVGVSDSDEHICEEGGVAEPKRSFGTLERNLDCEDNTVVSKDGMDVGDSAQFHAQYKDHNENWIPGKDEGASALLGEVVPGHHQVAVRVEDIRTMEDSFNFVDGKHIVKEVDVGSSTEIHLEELDDHENHVMEEDNIINCSDVSFLDEYINIDGKDAGDRVSVATNELNTSGSLKESDELELCDAESKFNNMAANQSSSKYWTK